MDYINVETSEKEKHVFKMLYADQEKKKLPIRFCAFLR